MAALYAQFKVEDVSLGNSGGWKTLLQIAAPANQRGRVVSYGIYPRSTTNSSPGIKLRLLKQTDAGTGGSAATPTMRSSGSETLQFSGLSGPFSGEPTAGDVQDLKGTHPQMPFEETAVESEQWIIHGGERWGLQYDNDGGEASIPCDAEIAYEE